MLVAKVIKNSAVKLKPAYVATLVRWVVMLGSGEYVNEANAWHSSNVDPCRLTIIQMFYQLAVEALPSKVPVFAVNLYELAHNETGKIEKQFPHPGQCNWLTACDMKTLANNHDKVKLCEKLMINTRKQLSDTLEKINAGVTALTMLRPLENNMVRNVLGKPLETFNDSFKLVYPTDFPKEQMHGFNEQKAKVIRTAWVKYLESKYPDVSFKDALRVVGLDVYEDTCSATADEAIV